jgi:hypothetical protein
MPETALAVTPRLSVTLPREYPLVLLMIMLFALLLFSTSFFATRGKYFTKDILGKFEQEHKDGNCADNTIGFPDSGEGRYSQALSYKNWHEYMSSVRASANFQENFPTVVGILAIGGLYMPVTGAAVGLLQVIGRIMYFRGYIKGGPGGRLMGATIAHVSLWLYLFVSLGAAIAAMFIWKPIDPVM